MDKSIQIGNCKACDGKVSYEAASCPHCGQPSPFQKNISVVLDSQGRPEKIFKPNIPANANTEEIWMPVEATMGIIAFPASAISDQKLGRFLTNDTGKLSTKENQ